MQPAELRHKRDRERERETWGREIIRNIIQRIYGHFSRRSRHVNECVDIIHGTIEMQYEIECMVCWFDVRSSHEIICRIQFCPHAIRFAEL